MWFKVTWPSGLMTHEESETLSREAYAMERWGANMLSEVEAMGVKIEHAVHEELVALGLVSGEASLPASETQVATQEPVATEEMAPTSPTHETTESTTSDHEVTHE